MNSKGNDLFNEGHSDVGPEKKELVERERILRLVEERRLQREQEQQKKKARKAIYINRGLKAIVVIGFVVLLIVLNVKDKHQDDADKSSSPVTATDVREVDETPQALQQSTYRPDTEDKTEHVATPAYAAEPKHADADAVKVEVDSDGKIHITIDPSKMSQMDWDRIMQNYLESVDINDLMDYYGYDPEE